jgi:hypothetical protein
MNVCILMYVIAFLYTHVMSNARALQMGVVFSYKTGILAFQSTVSPKYLDTTHCIHSALPPYHHAKSPTPHPLILFSLSV